MQLLRLRNKLRRHKPFDAVDPLWGGWNYPKPTQVNGADYHPGQDPRLKELIYMAEYGWHYCQKAIVEMQAIHPWTDYRPIISDEFRETFNARFEDDPMTLTIYEHDGKLIMGNDWETYWMYRERQDINAYCIIVGQFTQNSSLAIMDRPFKIRKPQVKKLHSR